MSEPALSWLDALAVSFLCDQRHSYDTQGASTALLSPSAANLPPASPLALSPPHATERVPLALRRPRDSVEVSLSSTASPAPATSEQKNVGETRSGVADEDDDWFSRRWSEQEATRSSRLDRVEAAPSVGEREWDRPKRVAGWDPSMDDTLLPRSPKRCKKLYLPGQSDDEADDLEVTRADTSFSPSTSRWTSTPSTSPDAPLPRSLRPFGRLTTSLEQLWEQLTQDDVEPFLHSSRRIDNERSNAFLRAQARFLCSCSPPEHWRQGSAERLKSQRPFVPAAQRMGALDFELDKRWIQRKFPLGRLEGAFPLQQELPTWMAVQGTMRWIWDESTANFGHVAWLAEEAPVPLFALVRLHTEIGRFQKALCYAWTDLTSYLLHPSPSAAPLTPREQRAAVLLSWLNAGGDARKSRFFTDDEGPFPPPSEEEGGVEAWEWWWEEVWAHWGPRELDEWERERERELDGRKRRRRG
ncbi:hypothetical protein JCM10207_001465 [Rhodosporidiobolus poonsookiae]